MITMNCKHEFEYSHSIDKVLPFGDIISIAVFKCIKCGEEILEGELKLNDVKRRTN